MKTMRAGAQEKLFDMPKALPNGLIYRPNFITEDEEEVLLAYIQNLPLRNGRYETGPDDHDNQFYISKRRHMGFGWDYDDEQDEFIPGPPLPSFLQKIQRKIGKWLDIPDFLVAEALINEYTRGTGIGWHRDREKFQYIVGISLSGWCRIRFRPIDKIGDPKAVVSVELEPRSIYIMQGDVRWKWQHSVAPVEVLRYSITFRTLPKEAFWQM